HSGASRAGVHVRREGSTICVTIVDRGRGFTVDRDARGRPAGGFGLSGMAERARILNGTLLVRSSPGRGVRIELSVPIDAAAARDAATPPVPASGGAIE